MRVNKTVKTGPVLPNKVAFATEVVLTPQKKHAKCKPKNIPANATRARDFLFSGFGLTKILYIQRTALAMIILQKAIVMAGTEGSALIIREVELTENKAKIKIKYKRFVIIDKKFLYQTRNKIFSSLGH